jgi:hypothetical protein
MFDRRSSVRGRWWRAGVAGATVPLMVLLAALAGAPAQAEPVDMATQQYSKTTRDGWQLTLSIDNELVNSVPNLAAALNSREGFVTLSATATATGGSAPITDSLFIAGYQLGCQSDVSSGLGIGGIASANASVGVPSGVNVGGGLTGFIQTVIQPGVITELPLANMALSDGRAMLDIDNIHIKADACGGDVTIRSYAYLTDIDRRRPFLVRHLRRPRQDLATEGNFDAATTPAYFGRSRGGRADAAHRIARIGRYAAAGTCFTARPHGARETNAGVDGLARHQRRNHGWRRPNPPRNARISPRQLALPTLAGRANDVRADHIRHWRSRRRQHQPDRRPRRSTRQPCTGSRGGQRRHLCRHPAGTRSRLMRTWISVCCFATAVVIDGLLTTDDASPAGYDMTLSTPMSKRATPPCSR